MKPAKEVSFPWRGFLGGNPSDPEACGFAIPLGMTRNRDHSNDGSASLGQLKAFAAVAGLGDHVSLAEKILDRGQCFPIIAGIAGNRGNQIPEGGGGFGVRVGFHGVLSFW